MRAWQVEQTGLPTDVLRLRDDVDTLAPGPGHVAVQVAAAGLNLPDERLCRGEYALRPPLPFTPGLEAAGTVVATGEGVDEGLVGHRVVGVASLPHGALATEALIPAQGLYPLPPGLGEIDAAATLIAFTTGHLALHRRAALRAGETVLVIAGASGVGSAAVQLAVLAGARVIATAGGPAKLDLCRELGASVTIDHHADDVTDAVLTATDGNGVDVVYDPVGGDLFHAARRCLAREGRLLVVGFAAGDVADAPTNHVLYRNYSVLGVYFGGYSGPADQAWRLDVHAELADHLAAGRLRPVIDRVVPFDGDVPGALTDLAERRVLGKVVVAGDPNA